MLCIHCERFSDALLCPLCTKALEDQGFASLYAKRCQRCDRPLLDSAYPCLFCHKGMQAYAPYTGVVSTLLRLFKAGEQKVLSKVLAPLYIPMLARIEKPLLIPVPASRKGLATRGFDQMGLITARLQKMTGYPSIRLFAQKGEGQSKFLSRSERQERHTISLLQRTDEVFFFQQKGYSFVLLDDICTSGATLDLCTSLLEKRYAIEALSLVVALV